MGNSYPNGIKRRHQTNTSSYHFQIEFLLGSYVDECTPAVWV